MCRLTACAPTSLTICVLKSPSVYFESHKKRFTILQSIAKPKKIGIKLYETLDSLILSISDDGVGFAPNDANVRHGLGMTSMRERLHLVGGNLKIISKPGVGTRIEASIPTATMSTSTVDF